MYWLVVERNFRSVDLEWWQPLLGLLYSSPQWNGFMSHNAVLWFLPCLFVVETNEIESILDYMDSYNMRFCRLNPLPSKVIVKELPYLSRVNRQTPYAINLQIGIFRKDYLLQLLGTGELSAWDIENQLITETARAKNELFPDVVSVNRFVIPFVHGVIKGKWIRKSLSYVKKQYPEIKVSRDVIPLTMEIKIDLIDALQHVLSQKTRKRLKSFLRSLGVKFTTIE